MFLMALPVEYRAFRDAVAQVMSLYGYLVANNEVFVSSGERHKCLDIFKSISLQSEFIHKTAHGFLMMAQLTLDMACVETPVDNTVHLYLRQDPLSYNEGCSLVFEFSLPQDKRSHDESIDHCQQLLKDGMIDEDCVATVKGRTYFRQILAERLQKTQERLTQELHLLCG